MNMIYRLVWNSSLGILTVVGEFAKSKGKGKNSHTRLITKATGVAAAIFLAWVPIEDARAYVAATGTSSATLDGNIATNTSINGGSATAARGQAIAIGTGSISTGDHAIAIGGDALATGANSFAIGYGAAAEGIQIISLGFSAGSGMTTPGTDAIFIGSQAGQGATNATSSVALGSTALMNSNGVANFGLGYASQRETVGSYNIGLGYASAMNVQGNQNLGLGGGYVSSGGGAGSNVIGNANTAIGWQSGFSVSGNRNISLGVNAGQNITANSSISIGDTATASASNSMASGTNAEATVIDGIAIGHNASASTGRLDGPTAIAIGSASSVTASGGMAFGTSAMASATDAMAIGTATSATGINSIAIGNQVEAEGQGSIVISGGANAFTGASADELSRYAIVMGTNARAVEANSALAIGARAYAGGTNSVALGRDTVADGEYSIAQGSGAVSTGANSIAIGSDAQATGENSLSIGTGNLVSGNNSGAFGDPSTITGVGSYSVGNDNNIASNNAFVIGNNVTLGAGTDEAVALGNNATVSTAGGVALGANSNASRGVATNVYIPTSNAADVAAVNATKGTRAAVDVGSRQITSVGAGTEDSDAVNVAQLKSLASNPLTFAGNSGSVAKKLGETVTIKGGKTTAGTYSDANLNTVVDASGNLNIQMADNPIFNSVIATNGTNTTTLSATGLTVTGGPSVTVTGINAGSKKITNVANGVDGSDAVNMSQLTETNENVTNVTNVVNNFAGDQTANYTTLNGRGIRYVRTNDTDLPLADAYANGQGSTAVGYNARSTGLDSLALGRDAQSVNDGDVALGSDSVTAAAVATTGVRIGDVDYVFAGVNPLSTVSVGSLGNERTLTNVAAGRITASSTDAINGSQLFATNTAINTLDMGVVKYDVNVDGSVNYNSITLGGDTYDNSTHTGGTTITNVADGVNDSDAVNMSQLTETNESVTNVTNVVNNFAGDQTANYTTLNGRGIRYVRTNDTDLPLADAYANGQGSTAVGYNARSTGLDSLALGRDAQSVNDGDVALGSGSVTAAAVATTGVRIGDVDYMFAGINPLSTVSVGSLGNERTLTNVAAGRITADSTDAINGSQLFATNTAINTLDMGAVKYDINDDGTVNYNTITLGGDTYNSVTKTGGTRIKNVAYGIDDSDAVNVQQLNDATTNIYNSGVKYFHANSEKADSLASGMDSIAVGPDAQSLGDGSIAMGDEARSTGNGSVAIGQSAQTIGENSVAMGANAIANNDNDVALGAGSVTQAAVATTSVTINGENYAVAGTAPTSTVSVGSEGNERTITNVAAGRISADSTDAVNGSELYATNQAIEKVSGDVINLDASSVKYEINPDGTVNYNKVVMGGDTYDNTTHTGGTTITNVANGVNPSDAVNKYQLDLVDQSVTNISNGTDGMFQVNNTSNLSKPKPTGTDSTAGGAGATASGNYSTAIGANSNASHSNSVALGYNSTTDRDNSVSVGSAGNERQITNVAAGTANTDAVNVGQLKEGVNNSYQYTNKRFSDLKNMVDDQKDKLSAGIAGAMAMAGLPQPYSPGASMVGLAGGTYQGESAIALGISTISDNGKWVTKLSGTTNSQGDLGAAIGVGYQW